MIITQTNVLIQFGSGAVSVGTGEFEGGGYSLTIRPMISPLSVGEKIEDKSVVDKYSDMVCLWFPTLEQTLRVKAAIVNKTYEEVLEAWNKVVAEREAVEWVEKIAVKDLLDEQ